MARPPTEKVAGVRARLVARLRDGRHGPGTAFLSNRAIAERFGVSYQTADRLVRELCEQGLLYRRPGAGTYVPGESAAAGAGAQLLFHERARRAGSFGARLLGEITARLERERVSVVTTWVTSDPTRRLRLRAGWLPVIWESPSAVAEVLAARGPAVLLNDRPPSGFESLAIDSVAVDDFSGGACAAQLLARVPDGRYAILAGPPRDRRSNARVAGFRSIAKASVVSSPTWFVEGGLSVAGEAMKRGRDGVFCCNDRLAQAVVEWCRMRGRAAHPLVGFDDAPIAEAEGLTTIAIPWAELVRAAVTVVRRRLAGDRGTAVRQVVAPGVVIRESLRPAEIGRP